VRHASATTASSGARGVVGGPRAGGVVRRVSMLVGHSASRVERLGCAERADADGGSRGGGSRGGGSRGGGSRGGGSRGGDG
jgi:hypothetical protein